jgi:putative addiction module killer protein
MRVHVGPGYRVYFVRTGATVYVLLTGGDKSSQQQDIARAKRMARELKEMKS